MWNPRISDVAIWASASCRMTYKEIWTEPRYHRRQFVHAKIASYKTLCVTGALSSSGVVYLPCLLLSARNLTSVFCIAGNGSWHDACVYWLLFLPISAEQQNHLLWAWSSFKASWSDSFKFSWHQTPHAGQQILKYNVSFKYQHGTAFRKTVAWCPLLSI